MVAVSRSARDQRGVAMVAVMLAIAVASALGLGLVMSAAGERLAAANHDDGVWLANAAESALALAAAELAAVVDWSDVLDGSIVSSRADGPPGGLRAPRPGLAVDLDVLTNLLTCGRQAPCTGAQRMAVSIDRPWGDRNPRWRPFLYTLLDDVRDPLHPAPPYVVVWVGDDEAELDGDVMVDGGGGGAEGRYIVRLWVAAFAPGGGRRTLGARVARICTAGVPPCLPGSRVLSEVEGAAGH